MRPPEKTAVTVRRARRLRRGMSSAEVALWSALRARPAGLKFRRQHPAGPFVIDFYCAAARLAIEVDGAHHDRGERPMRDSERDAWLATFGILTIRIAARDLYDDTGQVMAGIIAAALGRMPLHHPASPGGPPPQAMLGED